MKLTLTVDEQHLKVSPKIFLEIIIAGTKIHMNNWNMYLCLQDSDGGRHHCHQDRSSSSALISGDWMELLLVGARCLPGDGRGGRQDEERRGNVNIAFWIKVDNGHQATAQSFWCSHLSCFDLDFQILWKFSISLCNKTGIQDIFRDNPFEPLLEWSVRVKGEFNGMWHRQNQKVMMIWKNSISDRSNMQQIMKYVVYEDIKCNQ